MHPTIALIILVGVVAARIYFGRLASKTFDALPEAERKRISSAMAAGSY
jgi:hypothetical protein